MRLLSLCFALTAATALAQGSAPKTTAPAAQPAVIVGVVAATSDDTAKKQADALASFISSAIKQSALPRVYADQEALAVAVSKGEVDVALMGPLAYLRWRAC
jgi:ABC-type phosphate/phosphonate transport system substrate-binding protein